MHRPKNWMQSDYVSDATWNHKMQIFKKQKNIVCCVFNFALNSYFCNFLVRFGNNSKSLMATRLLDC